MCAGFNIIIRILIVFQAGDQKTEEEDVSLHAIYLL